MVRPRTTHFVRSRKDAQANADLPFKPIAQSEIAMCIAAASDGKISASQAANMMKGLKRTAAFPNDAVINPALLASAFEFEGEEGFRVQCRTGYHPLIGATLKKSDKQMKKEADSGTSAAGNLRRRVCAATKVVKDGGQLSVQKTEMLRSYVADMSVCGMQHRRTQLKTALPALLEQLDEALDEAGAGKQRLIDWKLPGVIDNLEVLTADAAPATIQGAIVDAQHLSHGVPDWLWKSVQDHWFLAKPSISKNNCEGPEERGAGREDIHEFTCPTDCHSKRFGVIQIFVPEILFEALSPLTVSASLSYTPCDHSVQIFFS